MSETGDAASVPDTSGLSSGVGPGLTAGRGFPGPARSLSSPAPPGRLTSLRTRDLTLGGAFKKPKVINDTPKECNISSIKSVRIPKTEQELIIKILNVVSVLYFSLFSFFLKKTFEPNVHAVRKSKDE